jgi:Calx-beta domain-containing protein/VCBS repeat protein
MWFRSLLSSRKRQSSHKTTCRSQRATDRRRESRRLFLEPLEDRSLMAFSPAATYLAGTSPQDMIAADFNNDTFADVAVVDYSTSSVSVLLGNSNGTFQQPALTSPTGSYPRSVAVGDFNADGNLDLATANAYDVSVLLGDGGGHFAPSNQSPIGVGSNPQSVAVGDFNGDGLLDIAATSNVTVYDGYYCYWYCYPLSHTEGRANVLLGNGDGSFSGPNTTDLGYGYHSSAVAANLNGDAVDDFVTLNTDYGYLSALLGNSSGYLQSPSDFSSGYWPLAVAAGDVDGDGDTDLVTANYDNSVSVLLGDNSGGFTAGGNYVTGSYPTSIVLGDFTGDGNVDVATANYSSGSLSVLYGGGDGTFSSPANFTVGAYPFRLTTGYFNNDAWLDVATLNSGVVTVLLNNQTWPLPPPPVSINDVSVIEGDTGTVNANFTVSLSTVAAVDVTVHYETAAGTAAAGSDYLSASGDVTIPAGQMSQTISIVVQGDTRDEYDEQFFVNLSSPGGFLIADSQGVGTIVDDDDPPLVTINDVSGNEGNRSTTSFTFTVSLSEASGKGIYVYYATADGTATTADNDYVAKSGSVYFAPGQTTATIYVNVVGDKKKEPNETFFVNLTSATNATISDGQGVGTIINNDGGAGKGKANANTTSLADTLFAGDTLTTTRKRK